MKRYLLFVYDDYYPGGGWEDFANDFDSVQEALDVAAGLKYDRFEVVDTETKSIVKEGRIHALREEGQ